MNFRNAISSPEEARQPTLAWPRALCSTASVVDDEFHPTLACEFVSNCLGLLSVRIVAELSPAVLSHDPITLTALDDADGMLGGHDQLTEKKTWAAPSRAWTTRLWRSSLRHGVALLYCRVAATVASPLPSFAARYL